MPLAPEDEMPPIGPVPANSATAGPRRDHPSGRRGAGLGGGDHHGLVARPDVATRPRLVLDGARRAGLVHLPPRGLGIASQPGVLRRCRLDLAVEAEVYPRL